MATQVKLNTPSGEYIVIDNGTAGASTSGAFPGAQATPSNWTGLQGGLNNRRSNLRPATQSLNNANARKKVGGTSKFRGVSWNTGRARFVANITVNKNQKYLGEFDSEEAAALMYNIYAKRFFGEFATLNQLPTRFIPVRAITIVPQRRAT